LGEAQDIAHELLNVPTSFVLGQAAYESGWGGNPASQHANNFFGLNAAPNGRAPAFQGWSGTYIEPGGKVKHLRFPHPGFGTSGASFAFSYHGARVAGTRTPGAYAAGLVRTPGAFNSENPDYASDIVGTIATVEKLLPCIP
jgi:hypothetical protein